jgi:hypothetical protein
MPSSSKTQQCTFGNYQRCFRKRQSVSSSQGMYLEQLWQNTDDENEVQFLFRIDDINQTKALIHKLHSDTLAQDPNANLPEMTYLK